MGIKIYLDDVRKTPDGWIGCRWPYQVISLLRKGDVDELSLDHDLGNDLPSSSRVKRGGTGYDVITWIEEEVVNNQEFVPPKVIKVHSSNASARRKMEAGIKQIYKLLDNREHA